MTDRGDVIRDRQLALAKQAATNTIFNSASLNQNLHGIRDYLAIEAVRSATSLGATPATTSANNIINLANSNPLLYANKAIDYYANSYGAYQAYANDPVVSGNQDPNLVAQTKNNLYSATQAAVLSGATPQQSQEYANSVFNSSFQKNFTEMASVNAKVAAENKAGSLGNFFKQAAIMVAPFVLPGVGAAIAPSASVATQAAISAGVNNYVMSGGDVEGAVKAAIASYVGGVAGSWASDSANSVLVGNIAKSMTEAAIQGRDLGDAFTASLIQNAPSAISKSIPNFGQLPRAVQEAAVAATVDVMRSGGSNLEQIAKSSVAKGATDYALSQIDGYKNLRPAQQEIIRTRVSNVVQGKDLSNEIIQGAISFGQETVQNEVNNDSAKKAGWPDYATQQAAQSLYGSKVTPELYADKQDTTEAEAKQIARDILGREPTEFEYMQLIGLPEREATQNSDLAAIRYDESTFDSAELAQAYKAVYGKEPTAEWLASDEAVDLLGRSDAQGKSMLQEVYTQDKSTVTKDEAVDFWKKAGFTDTPNDAQLKDLMGLSEAGAESLALRINDIEQTTFNGAGYGTKTNAENAAKAAGYNTYSWDGKEYNIPATAEAQKIEDKRYALTEEILKSQGTSIAKATDAQLQDALTKVNAVPTSMLGNATLKDVVNGTYSVVDADGTLRVELTGQVAVTGSSNAAKAAAQLPPGMVLASDSEVWGKGGARNANVEYMVLPDGTSAYVKRSDGKEITQLPDQIIVGKRLDELAANDPEAWLQMASQFDKTAKGNAGDYLANTANSLMLGAYATGNNTLGDSVKQTLSIATQGVGEQVTNLSTFFTDRLGMDHNSAMAAAGKALQTWGAANQSKSTKDQEAAIIASVSGAKSVGEKIGAFVTAAKNNPGGLMTMIAKEGVQEILPLWAAKAAYRLGSLAAVSANTAVEAMESWGAGTKETYDQAKKMGFSDDEARIMASKVGLQSAVITTFTNGIGDTPLVKRIIGDTVKDSVSGIAKAGVREGFTEYFDELGQNAVKQYQLTGTVNWDQATTAATIGMGVGAGTTSGIMLGASINSAAVIGKDAFGKNVSYADFMSGEKQVDMKTLNLNAQVGTAKDGDAITLGSITAMPMASGISYDMVKSGLPPALSSMNVSVGKDALGNDVTLSSLMSGVNKDNSFDTLYKNLLNTTPEQSKAAQTKLITDTFKDAGYTPSAAEINALIAAKPTGTTAIKNSVSTYVAPRQVTEVEAKQFFADIGYKPTDAEVKQFVKSGGNVSETAIKADVAKYVDPLMVTDADARKFFADIGYTPTEAEIKQFVKQAKDADVLKEVSSYVDPRQVTKAEAEKFFADLGYKPTKAEIDAYIKQGGANAQAEAAAEAAGYVDPRMVTEQEAKDAYAALGLAEPTKADIDKLVGQYQQELLADKAKENLGTAQFNVTAAEQEATKNAIAALETQTKAQYDTLTAEQKALADALTAQGTTLADAIAAAQESTATQISDLEAQTTEQYNTLTAAQKATADALVAQGTTLSEAIETAKTETAGAIETLSADVQAKYDALTAEQKALADAMAQQGLDLTAAIDLAAQQTQEQITGLGEQVDTRINELMQQGQTYQQATQQAIGELNQQNQQLQGLVGTQGRTANQSDIDALTQMLGGQRSMDLAYDVTGDKQITQADIDFLTQVVGGVKTDWTAPQQSPWAATGLYGQIQANELRRQQDLAAAEAQRQAEQQAAAERARQESVRGGLRTTALQGQQQLQALQQQLPQAVQMSQTTSTPIYGEMGPYLDLGSPLDFDFFKPSPEKQAATKQAQPTKIAAGGYIDDLLAGDMTADDLLNLLR